MVKPVPYQVSNSNLVEPSFGSAAGFMAAVRPILPALRAYGRHLTGNLPDSDDLVQDTLARAWQARDGFQPGTNLKAWMIRIERNSFLTHIRRNRRMVELDPETLERQLVETAAQEEQLNLEDLDRAIGALPAVQREAFVGVSQGNRYEAVAEQLGIAEGTLKSRVSRARIALVGALENFEAAPKRTAGKPAVQGTSTTTYQQWKKSGSRIIG
jgi:RNA polymerase sigma-70 factor (ECF subfamily)